MSDMMYADVADVKNSFLKTEYISMCDNFLLYFSKDEHQCCFHTLAIIMLQ